MVNRSKAEVFELINNAKVIFWDFDGVIKDSAMLKKESYTKIFPNLTINQSKHIKDIYEQQGGLSRYELIPIFYKFLYGKKIEKISLDRKIYLYSKHVMNAVIGSNYIPGVKNYIQKNKRSREFVIVTNTPKYEIDKILNELDLTKWFDYVYGAPTPKAEAINDYINNNKINKKGCILIGDSLGDAAAASETNIEFVHRSNTQVNKYTNSIDNFIY